MPRHAMTPDEVDAVRAKLRRNAASIIGKGGFASLSMRGLAQTIGLTPGALYRYYPSKQDLIIDYSRTALRRLTERFLEISERETAPLNAIRQMLVAYAHYCLSDRDQFRVLFMENDDGASAPLQHDPDVMAPLTILEGRVSQAICQALLNGEARRVTLFLWAGIHGIVCLSITFDQLDFGDTAVLAEEIAATILRGLTAGEAGL